MRLNHDLIRDLLITIEEISNGRINFGVEFIAETHLPDYELEEVIYHVKQLAQARLITVPERSTSYIIDLTWEGHQYIANIRDQTIWSKTKSLINPLGGATIDVIKDISKTLVLKSLGGD
ncbi:DUF2513 domain-containing protein [Peribacillus asahii]|uniref:DUF2513 domain-containing protein n=1 Tax=Peribacillus asahii TaxID=228899 RepID=UPI002079AD08|nr:DUF2513 domain-containing protein [Peribacillus asahii]USK61297.1 DUF2513 domain-containing protein [Peribacillus asahii]